MRLKRGNVIYLAAFVFRKYKIECLLNANRVDRAVTWHEVKLKQTFPWQQNENKLILISTNIMDLELYHKQPPQTSSKGQSLQVDARMKCYLHCKSSS